MDEKQYPHIEEEQNTDMCCEPAVAITESVEVAMPGGLPYAHIMDNVLQITPDIEEEIAEIDNGDIVTMSQFNTMFAKWLA